MWFGVQSCPLVEDNTTLSRDKNGLLSSQSTIVRVDVRLGSGCDLPSIYGRYQRPERSQAADLNFSTPPADAC